MSVLKFLLYINKEDNCYMMPYGRSLPEFTKMNKGISAAYLGQPDKGKVFLESSSENIFVTPEWLAKPEHKSIG